MQWISASRMRPVPGLTAKRLGPGVIRLLANRDPVGQSPRPTNAEQQWAASTAPFQQRRPAGGVARRGPFVRHERLGAGLFDGRLHEIVRTGLQICCLAGTQCERPCRVRNRGRRGRRNKSSDRVSAAGGAAAKEHCC